MTPTHVQNIVCQDVDFYRWPLTFKLPLSLLFVLKQKSYEPTITIVEIQLQLFNLSCSQNSDIGQ